MAMAKVSVFKSAEGADSFLKSYNTVLARWPVPYEELNIPTRFGSTHIITSGASDLKPLFLLHGMMGTGTAWLPNAADFSKHYRIYAIDLIGEPNKSEPVRPVKNRREFTEWLVEIFDRLGIDRANIVGNSFGGFLALNQASHTPDRIEKLVLISPAATFAQIWSFYFHIFPALFGSEKSMYNFAEWLQQGLPHDKDCGELARVASKHGRCINRVFPIVFKKKELQKVYHPTLLLIGDREVTYNPQEIIRRAEQLISNLQGEIVPNANHMAAMSNPEYVNKRIIQFLDSEST